MEKDGLGPEDGRPWAVPPEEVAGEHPEEILPPLEEMALPDTETAADDTAAAASETEPEPIPEDKQRLIDYIERADPGRLFIRDIVLSVYGVARLDDEKFREMRQWMRELRKHGIRPDGNSYIKLGKNRRKPDKVTTRNRRRHY